MPKVPEKCQIVMRYRKCMPPPGQVCKKVSDLAEDKIHNQLIDNHLTKNKPAMSNIILQTWPKLHNIDLNVL